MKLFFAGSEGDKKRSKLLLDCNATRRLESFFYLQKKGAPSLFFNEYLLDSGGFSARKSGVNISVEQYALFINKFDIKTAFNLDTNDAERTNSNFSYLRKTTKAEILPIYHYSDFISPKHKDDILRFSDDGCNFFAVGGVSGQHLSYELLRPFLIYVLDIAIKKNMRVHGLGMTKKRILMDIPFYSVDSTTWTAPSQYGRITDVKNKDMQKYLTSVRHHHYTTKMEIKMFLELEKTITEIWKKRGINYE